MARADLLRKLFRSYASGDNPSFVQAASEIIDDERRKNHTSLAIELARIIEGRNGSSLMKVSPSSLEPLPKDSDRGTTLLEIRTPDRYLDDLILGKDQLDTLHSISSEFRQWDILESNGLRPCNKLLFCGPPGCGKTATAEALSNELGIPLLYVRFDAVVSSFLGETAANLRKIFDYGSKGSWVLLFDEFDAIGRSRDDVTEHGELKRVVNAFLQLLDRFDGRTVVIAATNFEQSLDPALWRRFDEVIRFEKPDREQIILLLEKKLRGAPRSSFHRPPLVDKMIGLSHADIERICLEVLKIAVLEGKNKLTPDDMDRGIIRQERRKQALAKSRPNGTPLVDEV